MKVIILAAGVGSRLRPLTYTKPKGMVKVNGIPIIEHQIKAYLNAGILMSNITIAIGYKPNFIIDFLKRKYQKINFIENENYDTTNNMFSLNLCLQSINNTTLIISNGDCIYDPLIIKEFISNSSVNSVACDKNSYSVENMKILVEGNRIQHISKTIAESNSYGNSIDLYKIDYKAISKFKEIITTLISGDCNLWSELALDELFRFFEFIPFDIKGRKWMEIDNYNDLYVAEKKFSSFDLQSKKSLVFDLDGTVYLGEKPIQGTIDFIIQNDNQYDIYYMTNNTSRNLTDYVKKLNKLGINTVIDKILSPLLPLIDYLLENKIARIYLLGTENFKRFLKKNIPTIKFSENIDECEAVVVGYDTELTYSKLKTASLLLKNKSIQLLATHEDLVCPTEKGDIPDIGAILKLIEVTTNRKPSIIFGKPNPLLLTPILCKYKSNEIAIIGDRLYTDKVLANNADIDFILVLSGESKREDIESENIFPELILNDCGELNEYCRALYSRNEENSTAKLNTT